MSQRAPSQVWYSDILCGITSVSTRAATHTMKSTSDSVRCWRHGLWCGGMSGAAMADRNTCFGIDRPLERASARNSNAFQVPTLCATTCMHWDMHKSMILSQSEGSHPYHHAGNPIIKDVQGCRGISSQPVPVGCLSCQPCQRFTACAGERTMYGVAANVEATTGSSAAAMAWQVVIGGSLARRLRPGGCTAKHSAWLARHHSCCKDTSTMASGQMCRTAS